MGQGETVVVMNKRASGVVLISTMLLPGENDVPRQEIEESIANPNGIVKSWFDEETGFLHVKRGAKKARPMAENLRNVTVERAKDIIGKTESADALRNWARGENRVGVNQALTKRMRELEQAPNEDEKATAPDVPKE